MFSYKLYNMLHMHAQQSNCMCANFYYTQLIGINYNVVYYIYFADIGSFTSGENYQDYIPYRTIDLNCTGYEDALSNCSMDYCGQYSGAGVSCNNSSKVIICDRLWESQRKQNFVKTLVFAS